MILYNCEKIKGTAAVGELPYVHLVSIYLYAIGTAIFVNIYYHTYQDMFLTLININISPNLLSSGRIQ